MNQKYYKHLLDQKILFGSNFNDSDNSYCTKVLGEESKRLLEELEGTDESDKSYKGTLCIKVSNDDEVAVIFINKEREFFSNSHALEEMKKFEDLETKGLSFKKILRLLIKEVSSGLTESEGIVIPILLDHVK